VRFKHSFDSSHNGIESAQALGIAEQDGRVAAALHAPNVAKEGTGAKSGVHLREGYFSEMNLAHVCADKLNKNSMPNRGSR
jgi:hypothetical protein